MVKLAQNAGLVRIFSRRLVGAKTPCFIVFGVSNPSDSAELVPLMLEMQVWRPFSGYKCLKWGFGEDHFQNFQHGRIKTPCFIVFGGSNPSGSAELGSLMFRTRI